MTEWSVMLCPECKGVGVKESSSSFDFNTHYKCGFCDGMRFVAVNPEHLKKI